MVQLLMSNCPRVRHETCTRVVDTNFSLFIVDIPVNYHNNIDVLGLTFCRKMITVLAILQFLLGKHVDIVRHLLLLSFTNSHRGGLQRGFLLETIYTVKLNCLICNAVRSGNYHKSRKCVTTFSMFVVCRIILYTT